MGLHVLIVDDSPAMRGFIRRVVELSGFEVGRCLQASNGQDALRVLNSEWVDIILTDINMPEMNGEELTQKLQEDELLRTIPVIVVSTDSTENRVNRMLALGAQGYVKKPFYPETLRVELDRILGGAHA
jgi:two-component system, chemotaxis family, chemotaxis protein CheY